MKRVYTSGNLMDVTHLRDVLEREGIPCLIRNDILAGLAPEVPFTETFPELWVQNDADLPRADAIKADWLAPRRVTGQPWTCSACQETMEPQFTSCWKCGAPKA